MAVLPIYRRFSLVAAVLVSIGIVCLSQYFYPMWAESTEGAKQRHDSFLQFERERGTQLIAPEQQMTDLGPKELLRSVRAVSFPAPPERGEMIGILRVPMLGSDFAEPIIEGTTKSELDRGVGHMVRTALPGEYGNLYLAGHNFPVGGIFHDLESVRDGDQIIVDTKRFRYVYRVYANDTVLPHQLRVSAPIPGRHLGVKPDWQYVTLQTCTPAYDPDFRYVVFGKLVSIETPAGDSVWRA